MSSEERQRHNARSRVWKKANPEKVRASSKRYREANREKVNAWHRLYLEKNREKINARRRIWHKANPEKVKAYKKATYEKHGEAYRAYGREYHKTNRERLRIYENQYRAANLEKVRLEERTAQKNRKANDIQFKLSAVLRTRLAVAVRQNRKVGSAISDLGCSIFELKIYLEKQFKDGMTWDNYGLWHIDHRKPLAKFDLTNRQQLLEAVHYTNLQPLWAYDNQHKGAKVYEQYTIR
jgi:hypothetical protein